MEEQWWNETKFRHEDTKTLIKHEEFVIINRLLQAGAEVKAHDPVAMEEARRVFKNRITLVANGYEAVEGADALAVVTEWSEFRMLDFRRIRKFMKQKVIFDGRNLFHKGELDKMGFLY